MSQDCDGSTKNNNHKWTSKNEGGCTENPGVWSLGGTSLLYKERCSQCDARKETHLFGSQRNVGDTDKYTITLLDSEGDVYRQATRCVEHDSEDCMECVEDETEDQD